MLLTLLSFVGVVVLLVSSFCWSPSVDVVPRSRRQKTKRASKTRKKNEDKERKGEGERRERKESTLHYLLSELLFFLLPVS